MPARLPPPTPPHRPIEPTLPTLLRRGAPLLIFLLAFLVLGAGLGDPPAIVFDEAHYVQSGREIAQGDIVQNIGTLHAMPVNMEHPPLAKHLIAGSLELFGRGQLDLTWYQYYEGCEKAAQSTDDHRVGEPCPPGRTWQGCQDPHPACRAEAFAWRFPAALVGALGVAAAYLAGLRLFNSLAAGVLAGLFLLLDTLWYLQSRMALLDVYSAGFAVAALAAALRPTWPSRTLSGVFLGLALASKFPALFLAIPLIVIHGWTGTGNRNPFRRLGRGALFALAIPFVVYVGVYGPYFIEWTSERDLGWAVGQFAVAQGAALTQDFGFQFEHPSAAPPHWWIAIVNPTFYYCPTCPRWEPPLIYALPNAALWFVGFLAVVAVPAAILWRWGRTTLRPYWSWDYVRGLFWRPVPRTASGNLMLSAMLVYGTFLPWFIVQHTHFNFYATFNVPYVVLFVAGLTAWLWQRSVRAQAWAFAYVGTVAFWFVAWWPIAAGVRIPRPLFDVLHNLVPWIFYR